MPKKSRSTKNEKRAFTQVVARPKKRVAGRTAIESTPIAIRSSVPLDARFEREMRQRLARSLGRFATFLERGTVRFEDVNGPRGGVDTECRVKLVLSGMPSVITSARGKTPEKAFAAVLPKVKAATTGAIDKRRLRAPAATHPEKVTTKRRRAPVVRAVAAGSLIGRRVGRGPANVEAVLTKPDRVRRDAVVDTALPGVSATNRRAGGGSTARRNVKKRTSRMTATLEDSRTKPSRKSTRRSKNRQPSGTKLARRARAETASPSSRARRASTSAR